MPVPELALSLESRGDSDGVVESEAEGLMSLVTALVPEHVLLQVVADLDQSAAFSIHQLGSIGAGCPTVDRSS